MATWEKRRVGRTDLQVTVLGFGTATMGGSRIPVSREESEAMVRAAWDAGVRYVDTAPFYGVGASERRVGDALRDKPRNEWVLSTKVGRLLKPRRGQDASTDGRTAPLPFTVVYDYSHDGIMRSVEDSYQRLGLDKIDILYVHDIGAYQHKDAASGHMKVLRDSGYRALTELKQADVVSAIGIGVNEKEVLLEAMGWGEWDVFLLAGRYTLLEQAPLDDLLPLCEQRGTSIVIGGPLNSGILAGRDTWNYAPAPADVVERVKKIQAVCDRHNVPLPAAALQFPLAHPAVAATIPGPRTVAEFRTNLELMRMKIPRQLWDELKHEKLLHADARVPA
ncbi:MAG TPA: aldo/keto reductase [Acetobacteraceae bacterium]|nr:aldo/keto reductase [Acetobacteraceae bacterium]